MCPWEYLVVFSFASFISLGLAGWELCQAAPSVSCLALQMFLANSHVCTVMLMEAFGDMSACSSGAPWVHPCHSTEPRLVAGLWVLMQCEIMVSNVQCKEQTRNQKRYLLVISDLLWFVGGGFLVLSLDICLLGCLALEQYNSFCAPRLLLNGFLIDIWRVKMVLFAKFWGWGQLP